MVDQKPHPPRGFDVLLAVQLAPIVAIDIELHQRGYKQETLELFQRVAGIRTDGLYGDETRNALAVALLMRSEPAVGWLPAMFKGDRSPYRWRHIFEELRRLVTVVSEHAESTP